jgi:hypothetical protein
MYLQYFTKGIDTIGKLKDEPPLSQGYLYMSHAIFILHPFLLFWKKKMEDEGCTRPAFTDFRVELSRGRVGEQSS